MPIRPQDLRDQRFRMAFQGVARSEVRQLLDAVAEDYDVVFSEVARLRGDLAAAGTSLVDAREQDREATRLLSQAEADARAIRARAEREAADLIGKAEARMAAMLSELEAERTLLADRIGACLDREQRLTALLGGQLDEAAAFLATEPVLATPEMAPEQESPAGADAGPVEEGSPWSAADVSQALAAATGHVQSDASDPEDRAGDWVGFDPVEVPERVAHASPVRSAADAAGRTLRTSLLTRGRLVTAGLAAAAIVFALATPGSSPGPETSAPASRPAAGAIEQAATRDDQPLQPAEPAAGGAATAIEPPATEAQDPIPAGTLRVTIEAVRPCWLRLTVNGRSFERELKAGETLTRDSTTDIVLRAGNAGALVVTLNGRTLPPLGREGEIVTRRLTKSMAK